ncbi:unnamed protein product [Nyctereutes procyonoides]|uniref:(raccoon dog) hypothetical protein n=1 Tax=Nyctereutes procyonoides TaxID=34880 RepID=A0A811ZWU9_NYCPR|nr:unnamed protein product [Nyctereutes procyonoides]
MFPIKGLAQKLDPKEMMKGKVYEDVISTI